MITQRILFLVAVAMALLGCNISSSGHDGHEGHGGHDESEQNLDTVSVGDTTGAITKQALMARGETLYKSICLHCHQANGKGVAGSIPPLANSDFLMAERLRPVRIVLRGLSGPIVVNGVNYNGTMPAIGGSDTSVAAVLTYVRNHFNGATDSIGVEEVRAYRDSL